MNYIGDKEIKSTITLEEKTTGGGEIVEVEYVTGLKESFAKIMYDKLVSEEQCDATALRDKRVRPVIETLLFSLREWGIKTSELGYISALLNQSLEFNEKEALKMLWKPWLPTINSLDDIDLIAVDRVLRANNQAVESPYNDSD